MPESSVIMALIAATVVAATIGYSRSDAAWQRDCQKLGRHLSGNVVYECRKVTEGAPK